MKTEEELIWENYIKQFKEGRGDEVDFPIIVEGLIMSASLDTAKYIMQRNFSMIDEVSVVDSIDRGILLVYIVKKINEKTLNYILKTANILGYYPAGFGDEFKYYKFNKNDILNIESGLKYKIFFEAKYDKNVHIKKDLYHVTTRDKFKKIQRVGLTPKSMSKISEHPDRIYLAVNLQGVEFIRAGLKKHYLNRELITLKIDISKIRDHKFMNDPNFEPYGVYTYQNIPPIAIESTENEKNLDS
jgi:hypothetical protein